MNPLDAEEDPPTAQEKQAHSARFAEGLLQFAKTLLKQGGVLDPALVLRYRLAETLATMAFDHGVTIEDAIREARSAVDYRIARREDAERVAASKPSALH
jgi:hypothetical protein